MKNHDRSVRNGTLLWLNVNDPEESAAWEEVWLASRSRRPHDHPGYLRAMATAGNTPAAVVYDHVTGGRVMYAFYWRSLVDLPFCSANEGPVIHLVSPYGYGGPLYEGAPEHQKRVSEDFESTFRAETVMRGAVSEFVREDLRSECLALRTQGEHFAMQSNVVVRLDRTPEEIWRGYEAKVRKNVSRARRHGLRVVFDNSGMHLNRFLDVYYETMARNGAASSFYFDKETFELLGQSLGKEGGLIYAHVFEGEKVISTELLLLSSDTIYSFLGGTLQSSFEKRPNDLLKHEVIMWGGRCGFKSYVLGGGVVPGDGIFRYKKAFDSEGILPFFVRRICHDSKSYNRLTELRAEYESRLGRQWKPRDDFFPAYLS